MSEDGQLADKVQVLNGFAFPSSGFTTEEGLPLVRIRDIASGRTEVNFRGKFDTTYLLKNGDVLIGMDGDFLVARWSGGDALLNQRVCKVASNSPEIDQAFLFWFLQPHINEIHQKTPQTTVRHLSTKDVRAIPQPVHSTTHQSKIAEILDTLDAAIRGTEAVVAKLKAMKQGLLQDLLTRGIDANGDLRPPQPEAPHLYKQTPRGWLPREWETPFLDNVAQRGSGHTPSKSIASYWNGGIRWVSLADSHRLDQVYIFETDKEISEAGLANSSAVRHPENTVILSRDAGIGKSAILASEMAVSQHFMAWKCGAKLNHTFLYYVLQRAKPKFEAIAMGSTIKTIGLSFFKKYKIALPPIEEQRQSADVLSQAEGDITRHAQELAKLKHLKSGLMDDLLTGRVPVTPLL